ncbi:hypothetical protein ABPG72_014286 [Tetrahymena utriculariae]
MLLSILLLSLLTVKCNECPEVQSYQSPMIESNYESHSYLKIPQTNILLVNTYSSNKSNSMCLVYYLDLSSSQKTVSNIIQLDYQINIMDYVEYTQQIVILTYNKIILADFYTLTTIYSIFSGDIISARVIPSTRYLLMTGIINQLNIFDIVQGQIVKLLDHSFDGNISFKLQQNSNIQLFPNKKQMANVLTLNMIKIACSYKQTYDISLFQIANVDKKQSQISIEKSNFTNLQIFQTQMNSYLCKFNSSFSIPISVTYSTTGIWVQNFVGLVILKNLTFENSYSNSFFNNMHIQSQSLKIQNISSKKYSFVQQNPNDLSYKQNGGVLNTIANQIEILDSCVEQSTSQKGSFLYVQSFGNDLNINIFDSYFSEGYGLIDGGALFIDTQGNLVNLNCKNYSFVNVYTFYLLASSIATQQGILVTQQLRIFFNRSQKFYNSNIESFQIPVSCQNCNGGAIILENGNIKIQNTIFYQINSLLGGAIFLNKLAGKNLFENTKFINCSSSFDGGAVYVYLQSVNAINLTINKCQYENNTSAFIFSKDSQSYPTKLSINKVQQFLKISNSQYVNGQIEVNDFRSGDILSKLSFEFLNDKEEVVISATQEELNQFNIQIRIDPYAENRNNYKINGNQQVNFDLSSQLFMFQYLTLIGKPNCSVVIQFFSNQLFTLNNQTNKYYQNYTFDLKINFRNCISGEQVKQFNSLVQCEICQKGQFSRNELQCQNFPQNAQCLGGDKIVTDYGFWRKSSKSSLIIQCENQESNCVGGDFDKICKDYLTGQMKQSTYIKLFNNYQKIISSITTFNLNMPSGAFQFPTSLGQPEKQSVSSVECLLVKIDTKIPMIYLKLIFSQIISFVYLIIFISGYFIYHLSQNKKNKREKFPSYIINSAFTFQIIYLQPDLVTQIISLLSCRSIGGENYILSNISYYCYTHQQ